MAAALDEGMDATTSSVYVLLEKIKNTLHFLKEHATESKDNETYTDDGNAIKANIGPMLHSPLFYTILNESLLGLDHVTYTLTDVFFINDVHTTMYLQKCPDRKDFFHIFLGNTVATIFPDGLNSYRFTSDFNGIPAILQQFGHIKYIELGYSQRLPYSVDQTRDYRITVQNTELASLQAFAIVNLDEMRWELCGEEKILYDLWVRPHNVINKFKTLYPDTSEREH